VTTQSISLSKLAGLMDMDETSLRSQLMLLKQVRPSARCNIAARCLTQIAPLQPLRAHVPAGQTRRHTDGDQARLLLWQQDGDHAALRILQLQPFTLCLRRQAGAASISGLTSESAIQLQMCRRMQLCGAAQLHGLTCARPLQVSSCKTWSGKGDATEGEFVPAADLTFTIDTDAATGQETITVTELKQARRQGALRAGCTVRIAGISGTLDGGQRKVHIALLCWVS